MRHLVRAFPTRRVPRVHGPESENRGLSGCVCGRPCYGPSSATLTCEACRGRFHQRCAQPPRDIRDSIWVCASCEPTYDFEVERIVRCLTTTPRTFEVKWVGFHRTSMYVQEEDLMGSAVMLQIFLQSRGLPASTVCPNVSQPEAVGCSRPDSEPVVANWVKPDQLVPLLNSYYGWFGYKSLKISLFLVTDKLADEDMLGFLVVSTHVFVFLHLFHDKTVYLSDGENAYSEGAEWRWQIDALFAGLRVVSLPFRQQSLRDHCGSSAVVIAGELWRMYNSGRYLNFVDCDRTRLDRIRHRCHKEPSARLGQPSMINEHPRYRCRGLGCNATFTARRKRNFVQHERRCPKVRQA